MIVVDDSVIVKLLVDEPGTDAARDQVTSRDDCIAPDILLVEVASALAKKIRFAGLPEAIAYAGMDSVHEFVAELTQTAMLLRQATDLSIALDHSIFDCLYLALAIERGCPVLTADLKFVNAAVSAGYEAKVQALR